MTKDSVAIVGMSCRFAGAPNLDRYWDVLREGRDTVTRGLADGATAQSGMSPVDAFGALEGIDIFDNAAFGVTAGEARTMDPQHRIWLELVWHALEDAGLRHRSDLRTGVFAGSNRSAYLEQNVFSDPDLATRLLSHVSIETRRIRNGNERDFLPLRTSFAFDLDGPSVNVQTACSTGLVSVAMACDSLLRGDSDICLAGAISISRTTAALLFVEPEAIHSASGHCRPFADTADGTVFGDGGGVVVLRRLSDAIADRQRVYCVVQGWAVTNDGGRKPSFAAPSAAGQSRAICAAWQMAGTELADVSYVEAHGTGTKVGDPLEFEGLLDALGESGNLCRIGSAKANIGHTDTAAGVAGLIKTALMLHYRKMVATPGVTRPNPLLGIEDTRFEIATALEEWRSDMPRQAGVTALGVGGTNCHVAMSEAPPRPVSRTVSELPTSHLLLVSAGDDAALARQIGAYAGAVEECGENGIRDLCLMSALGRRHLRSRFAVVGKTAAEIAQQLTRSQQITKQGAGKPNLLFAFTGQLSSYSGMARDHYAREATFAKTLDTCADVLAPLLDKPLTDILFEPGATLSQTRYEQPALCALQISLVEMWRALGIRPTAALGYSVGEFAACYASGVVPLAPLLEFVAKRGAIMEELSEPGYMAVVRAPKAAVEELCENGSIEMAGLLGPGLTIVAGKGAPDAWLEDFPQGDVRVLSHRYGFHSGCLDPCLDVLRTAAAAVPWQRPSLPLLSTCTGQMIGEVSADYWVEHARRPVRFQEALVSARAVGANFAVEIGPRPVLTALAAEAGSDMPWSASLTGKGGDWDAHLRCLAELFQAGADPDWQARFPDGPRTWVDLPKYEFAKTSCWTGPLPERGRSSISITETWSATSQPHFTQHRLFGRIVVPASHHVSWVLDNLTQKFGHSAFVVSDWVFQRPAELGESGEVCVTLQLDPCQDDRDAFDLTLCSNGSDVQPYVTARVQLEAPDLPAAIDTNGFDDAFPECLEGNWFYTENWVNLDGTGERFRLIERVWRHQDHAVAAIRQPDRAQEFAPPAEVIEAAFQCLHAGTEIETPAARDAGELWVPYSIGRVAYRPAGAAGLAFCSAIHQAARRTATNAVADISLFDKRGEGFVKIEDFHLRPIRNDTLADVQSLPVFETTLEPIEQASVETMPFPDAWNWDRDAILATFGDRLEQLSADDYDGIDDFLIRLNEERADVRLAFVASRSVGHATDSASKFFAFAKRLEGLGPKISRLCVVTSWKNHAPTPGGAAVEALARVVMNEYPDWNVRIVGQETADIASRCRELQIELFDEGPARQIVWHSGLRHSRILKQFDLPVAPGSPSDAKRTIVVGNDGAQSHLLVEWLMSQKSQDVTFVDVSLDPAGAIMEVIDQSNSAPIGGVFFLPSAVNEGLIATTSVEEFESGLSERVAALTSVADAVKHVSLDHFVCFSSSAGVLGVQGQAGYAALTGWIDALCAELRCRGWSALSINWGPWAGVGNWSATETGRRAIENQGWTPIQPANGFDTLARAMASNRTHVHALPVDWEKLAASGFCNLVSVESPTAQETEPRRVTAVSELSWLIGEDLTDYPDSTTLVELGLDSLLAVRLRNFVKTNWGIDIPLAQLLSTTALADIAALGPADT